jgi:predicted acyl esterase
MLNELPKFTMDRLRRVLICLSIAAIVLVLNFTRLFSDLRAQTQGGFEISVTQNEMVVMRDGVRLATDIYRPARNGSLVEGKFPVILERTPYNKSHISVAANHFVPNGYIVIAQDVRGRYKSEGRWFPVRDDPNDGFEHNKVDRLSTVV